MLTLILFSIYTRKTMIIITQKFTCADLALATQACSSKELEVTLTSDLKIMEEYFQKRQVRPNLSKLVVSTFHLNSFEFCSETVL